jgi:hypothetical protein
MGRVVILLDSMAQTVLLVYASLNHPLFAFGGKRAG